MRRLSGPTIAGGAAAAADSETTQTALSAAAIRHNLVALARQAQELINSDNTDAIDRAAIGTDFSALGLAEEGIPDLVRRHPSDRPLRIWVAGCSIREVTIPSPCYRK